jgi:hypothetical protein
MTQTKKGVIAWLATIVIVGLFAAFQPMAKLEAGSICIRSGGPASTQRADSLTADSRATAKYHPKLGQVSRIAKARQNQLVAQAVVDYWKRELYNPYPLDRAEPQTAALLDSIGAAQAKLDLATRDLYRAMR